MQNSNVTIHEKFVKARLEYERSKYSSLDILSCTDLKPIDNIILMFKFQWEQFLNNEKVIEIFNTHRNKKFTVPSHMTGVTYKGSFCGHDEKAIHFFIYN